MEGIILTARVRFIGFFIFALLGLITAGSALAGTIALDTATAPWTVSGGGAVNATPFVIGGALSITSNTFNTGTFVTGGRAANFDGFWTASLQFFLPANATNVGLSYTNLQCDDRCVLELNGNIIGSAGIFGPGTGAMTFTDGGSNVPYTFDGSFVSGTASSGFLLGQTNALTVIMNDTADGIFGTLNTSGQFETAFAITGGAVAYTAASAVPEPNSGILLGSGVLLLVLLSRPRHTSGRVTRRTSV